jgi:hypothetical protein
VPHFSNTRRPPHFYSAIPKQAEVAGVAQAEGVSLPVARRILQVLLRPGARSVPTLGRATAAAGSQAGRLLEVLDEAARPRVAQATADEIFPAGRQSVRDWSRSGDLPSASRDLPSG